MRIIQLQSNTVRPGGHSDRFRNVFVVEANQSFEVVTLDVDSGSDGRQLETVAEDRRADPGRLAVYGHGKFSSDGVLDGTVGVSLHDTGHLAGKAAADFVLQLLGRVDVGLDGSSDGDFVVDENSGSERDVSAFLVAESELDPLASEQEFSVPRCEVILKLLNVENKIFVITT